MPEPRTIALTVCAACALAFAAVVAWHVRDAQNGGRSHGAQPRTGSVQRKAYPPPTADTPLPGARIHDTPHYRIHTAASDAQTRDVATAVEALHRAYAEVFGPLPAPNGRLQVVLYRDRNQFQAYNRSRPWAEAFYLAPYSHAYAATGRDNPHHWMVHEATHQLMREVSGFPRARWRDEGIATYFGASRLDADGLHPGTVDPHAYPIWWLARQTLSGEAARDIAEGGFLPLRVLVSGTGGPPLDRNVNLYYVHEWSLSHFLLHGDDGRHAAGYRRLLREGGGVDAFERHIGPLPRIEAAWYAYHLAWVRRAQRGAFSPE
jgi:hypothetical protein